MTDDTVFAEMETQPASPAPMPVWAPNPGVPLLARILAFLFAAALLYTAVMTFRTTRPPDPPIPDQWASYHLGAESTIPYPANWQTEERNDADDTREASFMLTPSSPVRLEVIVLAIDAGEHRDEVISALTEKLTTGFQTRFTNFALQDESFRCDAGDAKRFTFTLNGAPMTGALLFTPKGHHTLGVIGYAPPDGWPTMQDIFIHAANEAECDAVPNNK